MQSKSWDAFEGLEPSVQNRLSAAAEEQFLDLYSGWMDKNGVKIATPASDEYPALLGKAQNPPSVLFYRGTIHSDLNLPIAFMAFSKASVYGKEAAKILG